MRTYLTQERERIVAETKQADAYANRIWEHSLYQSCYDKIAECERTRTFCRHDMAHFLDVARLAEIFNLQERLEIPKKLIYGAALLHDIGRHEQYLDGISHEIASAKIAPDILRDCGYTQEEINDIVDAILMHRNKAVESEPTLGGILYRADKMSRSCFACKQEKACNWKMDKKNNKLQY